MNELKTAAEMINGREYGEETNEDIMNYLKENGLVLATGASDDMCILMGAINDEVYSETFFIDGEVFNEYYDFDGVGEYIQRVEDDFNIKIPYSSLLHNFDQFHYFETDMEHESCNILEDGEIFSKSIVFKPIKS